MLWFTRTYYATVMLFVLLCLAVGGCSNASAASLRDQLRELAQSEGFEIRGLGLITRDPARQAVGDLRHRIKRLLAGYNYVLIENEAGGIDKLIILARGKAQASYPEAPVIGSVTLPGEHVIPAKRRGAHQLVEAVLTGPGQSSLPVSLMVDTGASTVVLPRSLMGRLGFTADALRDGWTQTANGRVRAKVGVLRSVAVGTATAENVSVTFLDDKRLNGTRLLGMSFLQRFRMTIDDANSRIILTRD